MMAELPCLPPCPADENGRQRRSTLGRCPVRSPGRHPRRGGETFKDEAGAMHPPPNATRERRYILPAPTCDLPTCTEGTQDRIAAVCRDNRGGNSTAICSVQVIVEQGQERKGSKLSSPETRPIRNKKAC